MAHLAKGAKTHNNSQALGSKETRDTRIEWNKKASTDTRLKSEIHMIQAARTNVGRSRASFPNITFSLDDPIPEHCTGDNLLIITAKVETTQIHRIYVYRGSSTEIIYEHCFEQLTTEEKKTMRPPTSSLVGFVGQVSWPLGLITLSITLYDYRGHISKTVMADFMVVRAPSFYNIILDHSGMMKFGAVASTLHALVKFQTERGIAVVKSEKFQPNSCNHISRKRDCPKETKYANNFKHIVINDAHFDQTLAIAVNFPKALKEQLCKFLRSNKDVFAWTPAHITGIPQELAEHRLNIHPWTYPVWQKKQTIAKERNEAITTEV
ncbi:hypothetical protein Tco_0443215 [Tanacetum coccineum]